MTAMFNEPNASVSNTSSFLDAFLKPSEYLNCLEPLLEMIGWAGDKRQIADLLPHFSESLELEDFNRIMQTMNYALYDFGITLNQIDTRLLPCLFVSHDERVYIVKEITQNQVVVFSGHNGKEQCISVNDANIKGRAHTFKEVKQVEHSHIAKKMWLTEILHGFTPLIYQILLISLLLNLLSLATPLFIMTVYDKVISTESISLLINLSLGMLIALLGVFILQILRSKIIAYIGSQLDGIVGNSIFQRLIFLPSKFTESASVGAQVSKLKNFDTVRDFFTGPFVTIILEAPFTLIFVGLLWYLGGLILIAPILLLGLFAVASLLARSHIHRVIEQSSKASSAKNEFLIESLTHFKALKYCAAEPVWKERHKNLSAEAAYHNFKASTLTAILNAVADSTMMITGLCIITLGVLEVIQQEMTMGALIATMILVWKILNPIKVVFSNLTRIDQVKSSIGQINSLMEIAPERDPSTYLKPRNHFKGEIELHNVSLRYQPDLEPALLGVQLKIHPGEMVMITGNNAAGKSTLLKLILRLYTPQAGGIRIDGRDIRQIDSADLRHSIGYAPQINQFFYGTISQNLRLANPMATDEEIKAACTLAGLNNDIAKLPQGLNTRLRDSNKQALSVSFQQKLSLARAYVKKPSILILDEPTNNLDEESVKTFLCALAFFRRKTTIIMVSHRPSLFKLADRLIFMDEGRILSQGTPDAVLAEIEGYKR